MSREQRTGVYDLRETPKLEDLLQKLDRNLRVTIRTSTVGAIAASAQQPLGYDPATQLCSVLVQQLTVTVNPDAPQGQASTITQPPVLLVNVPVAWPRTNAGYLTFPLTPGDTGELIIQDRSLSEWRSKGIPVDPVDNWTHNRGDAVFHPGLHPDTNPLPLTDQTATVLEGPPVAGVKLGRSAASPLVKGDQLVAAFNTYTAAIAAAGSTWAGIVPPTPISNGAYIAAVTAATAALQASIGNWISTKALTE